MVNLDEIKYGHYPETMLNNHIWHLFITDFFISDSMDKTICVKIRELDLCSDTESNYKKLRKLSKGGSLHIVNSLVRKSP